MLHPNSLQPLSTSQLFMIYFSYSVNGVERRQDRTILQTSAKMSSSWITAILQELGVNKVGLIKERREYPAKRRAAVRYAAIAWSLSSCAAYAFPNPSQAGANVPSKVVALLQDVHHNRTTFKLGVDCYWWQICIDPLICHLLKARVLIDECWWQTWENIGDKSNSFLKPCNSFS